MSVQKFVTYTTLDNDSSIVSDKQELKLSVLETSGNYLIHKDLHRQKIHKKQGTSSSKTRSEVRGGGRKPWRQKGTGRARAGSNRSPLWKGGGVIFGPKPKSIRLKLNRKEKQLSLQTLLYNKRNSIFVVNNLESVIEKVKTKVFNNFCIKSNINLNQKLLIIVSEKTRNLKLVTQNLKKVELISALNLNTLALLKAQQILITTKAINDIKERYCD